MTLMLFKRALISLVFFAQTALPCTASSNPKDDISENVQRFVEAAVERYIAPLVSGLGSEEGLMNTLNALGIDITIQGNLIYKGKKIPVTSLEELNQKIKAVIIKHLATLFQEKIAEKIKEHQN